MKTKPIYLTDLIPYIGGWPIDMDQVGALLDRADMVLPGGRNCADALTPEQIKDLGFDRKDGELEGVSE